MRTPRRCVIFTSAIGSTVVEVIDEPFAPQRECAFFEHHHYVDLEPISRGAFGDVRRVRDLRTSEVLAMKVIRRCIAPESQAYLRFATEIEIMRSLRHPGILPVEEQGKLADGRLWFTMPEVRGRSYATVLDELHAPQIRDVFRTSSFRQALEALAQFCQIVGYAHARGVIHRDLKPKNLMVADDGAMFVIDWGIAKQLNIDELMAQRVRTDPGEVLGTPAYMPPEQAFGDISLQSAASDVYSLGAVLYHLLTGQPPYRGTRPAVISQIKRGPPKPISTIVDSNRLPPRELVALCEAAMQRKTNQRIAGAIPMMQNIREWLDRYSLADS